MGTPSVSVIIPAYNSAETIGDCLRSVIAAQHCAEREVIVVDDGSADDTCAIVEQHGCHLIRQPTNLGPAAALGTPALQPHPLPLKARSQTHSRSVSRSPKRLWETPSRSVPGCARPGRG